MTFEVWTEGFIVPEAHGYAYKLGTYEGDSFLEVCQREFGNRRDYNAEYNSIWGCRLFDNETDARKAFG